MIGSEYEFWCLRCPTRFAVVHDAGEVKFWAGVAYTHCPVCGYDVFRPKWDGVTKVVDLEDGDPLVLPRVDFPLRTVAVAALKLKPAGPDRADDGTSLATPTRRRPGAT